MFTDEYRATVQRWLDDLVEAERAAVGTVHVVHERNLHLVADVRLPPPVRQIVALVVHGKGMAGEAQIRGESVQVCNLKTDDSGVLKPGARQVDGRAAVAVPRLDEGEVAAVVGLSFDWEGEVPPDRVARLEAAVATLGLPAR